jgi:hypothetical protein
MSRVYREGKERYDMEWIESEMGKRLLEPLGLKTRVHKPENVGEDI